MQDQKVDRNLKGMDDLDFDGWNKADWDGVFAHHHTDDVLVDWKGLEPTRGIAEHIAACKAFVDSVGGTPRRSRSRTRSPEFFGVSNANTHATRTSASPRERRTKRLAARVSARPGVLPTSADQRCIDNQ